jgi:SAM-dependent methyltransferase
VNPPSRPSPPERGRPGARYLHGSSPEERRRLETLAELLKGDRFLPPIRPGARVLEVGCGTGAIARRVGQRASRPSVVGVDVQFAQTTAVRELRGTVDLSPVCAAAERLPFGEGSFDAGYCRFVLEHLTEPSDALHEMLRVLKPGAWICALEWDPDVMEIRPACPGIDAVWGAIYAFQSSTGANPRVAHSLAARFREVGAVGVSTSSFEWTVTANEPAALAGYVSGARQIIAETRDDLLRERLVGRDTLALALDEYQQLLGFPTTVVKHALSRAVGRRSHRRDD